MHLGFLWLEAGMMAKMGAIGATAIRNAGSAPRGVEKDGARLQKRLPDEKGERMLGKRIDEDDAF